jgi:molybdate transport system ATP-binding protein
MLKVSIRKKFRLNGREWRGESEGYGVNRTFGLNVEFTVPRGMTILFGPSGSGKTTCLRAVAGVLRPDEGRISLDEHVYFDSESGIDLPVQQRRVGFVFQDYLLFPHLTAEQNVVYGIRNDKGKDAIRAGKTGKYERARELLALLGIEYAARQYPRHLSGGESQRVALARALASDPAIMLLDEPLSAVDVKTRSHLLEEIGAVQRRTGIPFVYVTHHTAEAIEIGTYAVVIERGRVVREGAPREALIFKD